MMFCCGWWASRAGRFGGWTVRGVFYFSNRFIASVVPKPFAFSASMRAIRSASSSLRRLNVYALYVLSL
nr:MAG TPA: hypothetical protein [Caudoviricetes sp.]